MITFEANVHLLHLGAMFMDADVAQLMSKHLASNTIIDTFI